MAKHPQPHPIDRMIADHLASQGTGLKTEQLLRRIQRDTGLSDSRDVTLPVRRHTNLRRYLAVAAALLLLVTAFILGRFENNANAEPDRIIRAALDSHLAPVERCYVVSVHRDDTAEDDLPALRDARIWTQGDRFWVDVNRGNRNWSWGRSGDGDVWLTLGPRRAVRIEADEIGPPLRKLCDLYSLEIKSLLASTLRDHKLEQRQETATSYIVHAQPLPGTPTPHREITVEFDKESRAVRQLQIIRTNENNVSTEIQFTLVESRTPDESKYEPEGHLTKPYSVFSGRASGDGRAPLLKAWFGPSGARWIRDR